MDDDFIIYFSLDCIFYLDFYLNSIINVVSSFSKGQIDTKDNMLRVRQVTL